MYENNSGRARSEYVPVVVVYCSSIFVFPDRISILMETLETWYFLNTGTTGNCIPAGAQSTTPSTQAAAQPTRHRWYKDTDAHQIDVCKRRRRPPCGAEPSKF